MARKLYNIPHNFAEEGTILNGKVRMRNAIEAVILGIVLLIPLCKLPFGIKTKIYIGIIVVLPVIILAVVGIMGESLCSFIVSFLMFMKNRRVLGATEKKEERNNVRRNTRVTRKAKASQGARETAKETRKGDSEAREAGAS